MKIIVIMSILFYAFGATVYGMFNHNNGYPSHITILFNQVEFNKNNPYTNPMHQQHVINQLNSALISHNISQQQKNIMVNQHFNSAQVSSSIQAYNNQFRDSLNKNNNK